MDLVSHSETSYSVINPYLPLETFSHFWISRHFARSSLVGHTRRRSYNIRLQRERRRRCRLIFGNWAECMNKNSWKLIQRINSDVGGQGLRIRTTRDIIRDNSRKIIECSRSLWECLMTSTSCGKRTMIYRGFYLWRMVCWKNRRRQKTLKNNRKNRRRQKTLKNNRKNRRRQKNSLKNNWVGQNRCGIMQKKRGEKVRLIVHMKQIKAIMRNFHGSSIDPVRCWCNETQCVSFS